MAAIDNLSPPQFYHASPHAFAVGDQVEPGHEPVASGRQQDHVFVTSNRRNALTWAKHGMDNGNVYKVSTPKDYEPDPVPTGKDEFRTKESLTVTGRLHTRNGGVAGG
jgi:hypothetical protein